MRKAPFPPDSLISRLIPTFHILLLVAVSCTSTSASLPPTIDDLESTIDAAVYTYLQDHEAAGLTIAVQVNSSPIFSKGYGMANLDTATPAGSPTVYAIGSVSMSFTAAAIMQMVERGLIALDDPVTTHLPGFSISLPGITIHHLLNHTSGMVGDAELPPDFDQFRSGTPQEVVTRVAELPRASEPGNRWSFSSAGYFLLGLVIENVSGMGYGKYLENYLFPAADLKDTNYCSTPPINLAQGYQINWETGIPETVETWQPGMLYAAGGICSTAPDLVRWHQALANGQVINSESYNLMTSPNSTFDGSGYGLFINTSRKLVFMNGRLYGYETIMQQYPHHDVTLALLSNTTTQGFNTSLQLEALASSVAADLIYRYGYE